MIFEPSRFKYHTDPGSQVIWAWFKYHTGKLVSFGWHILLKIGSNIILEAGSIIILEFLKDYLFNLFDWL